MMMMMMMIIIIIINIIIIMNIIIDVVVGVILKRILLLFVALFSAGCLIRDLICRYGGRYNGSPSVALLIRAWPGELLWD
jgi:hypothetical protein